MSSSDSSVDDAPVVKKRKSEDASASAKAAKSKRKKSESGSDSGAEDNKIELGNKRFITVDEFKGRKRVDIREYYGDPGELKPGKKGISLSPDQWKTLKKNIAKIDKLLDAM